MSFVNGLFKVVLLFKQLPIVALEIPDNFSNLYGVIPFSFNTLFNLSEKSYSLFVLIFTIFFYIFLFKKIL